MLLRRVRALGVGALLAAISTPLVAQSPIRVIVRGAVFDSVTNAPLARALVRIVRADDPSIGRSATTDDRGAFTYDTVAAGVWLASFTHPVLDSLLIEPAIVRLEITDSSAVQMPLATPAPRQLASAACPGLADDGALITGSVRNADDDRPLAGAMVEVEWPEWLLGKEKMTTELQRRRAQSDSLGRYTLCGAPGGSTLRVRSWAGADSAGFVEVIVPDNGYAVRDFHVATSGVRVAAAPAPADSVTRVPTPRAGAIVRGRITTSTGAPLPNAIVRVLGTGSTVRTNEQGEFRIADANAGSQSIEARAIGYSPVRRPLRLRTTEETSVELALATRNVELDTVRVTAGREIPWDVRNIERRWRTGMGQFMNQELIAARATQFVTDALRGIANVQVWRNQFGGQEIQMRSNNGSMCRAGLWIDGMRVVAGGGTGALTIDDFTTIQSVAAIEVYNRPTMVPAEYLTMDQGCGVVAVWTKAGVGNIPILPPKSARPSTASRQ